MGIEFSGILSAFRTVQCSVANILLTKTTAPENEVALTYHRVRGLYFQTVIFAATMITY